MKTHFTFRGKRYQLTKRDRIWYLHVQHKKQRYKRSLATTERAPAIETARTTLTRILDGLPEPTTPRTGAAVPPPAPVPESSTLATFIAAADNRADCRRAALCLQNILAYVHGPVIHLTTANISEFTGREYVRRIKEEAGKQPTQARGQQILRSARSIFNQARCALSPGALETIRAAGVTVPDPKPFVDCISLFGKVAPAEFDMPSDAVVRNLLWGFHRLTRFNRSFHDDGNHNELWAIGLMLACGLRKAEVSQARWNWITERQGIPVLYAPNVTVKNHTGKLEVVPLNPFWKLLMIERERYISRFAPGAFDPTYLILRGTATERTESVFRRVGTMLREWGWTTQKTNHALRHYSASMIAMKYGLTFAKQWCRHSSVTTTEKHYGRFIDPVTMVQRAKRLKWLKFVGEK